MVVVAPGDPSSPMTCGAPLLDTAAVSLAAGIRPCAARVGRNLSRPNSRAPPPPTRPPMSFGNTDSIEPLSKSSWTMFLSQGWDDYCVPRTCLARNFITPGRQNRAPTEKIRTGLKISPDILCRPHPREQSPRRQKTANHGKCRRKPAGRSGHGLTDGGLLVAANACYKSRQNADLRQDAPVHQ